MKARKSFVEFDGVIQPNPAPRFSSSDNAIRHAPVKAGQNNNEICEKFELNRSCFK
jgi:alpha-methylacyl-CoA racemase